MVRNKMARQAEIRQIIKQQRVQTQEELARILNDRGWNVTQATVSRDISSMQLVKVPLSEGGFAYDLMRDADYETQVKAILQESQTRMQAQGNLIMVKVLPGTGPALKTALEALDLNEIFGVVGDDNGALIIVKAGYHASGLMDKLTQLP